MIRGYATDAGTRRYCERHDALSGSHFRRAGELWLTSLGFGTYLGDPDDEVDERYAEALSQALQLGCNVVDTAINYRCQRSERVIGEVLAEEIAAQRLQRDEVFVSSKAGFIPFDGAPPDDPPGYFERTFVDEGVLTTDELVAGCHCMTPRYLEHQVGRSRDNLGLETIDLYYVHNPETQLSERDRREVMDALGEAFEKLEELAERGWLRAYGVATWEGFRTAPEERPHLALQELTRLASDVGGEAHHFRAIQLPLNLGMPEALSRPTQPWDESLVPPLAAAGRLGLTSFASGSLHQGQLVGRLPPWMRRNLGEEASDAQRALQFTRSCPGLTTALVGMSDPDHVEENLALAEVEPLEFDELREALRPPDDDG